MNKALISILVLAIATSIVTRLDARKWTDGSGKFSVEATLVRVQDGNVLLKKADASVVAVPISRLSSGDQKHIRPFLIQEISDRLSTEEIIGQSSSLSHSGDGSLEDSLVIRIADSGDLDIPDAAAIVKDTFHQLLQIKVKVLELNSRDPEYIEAIVRNAGKRATDPAFVAASRKKEVVDAKLFLASKQARLPKAFTIAKQVPADDVRNLKAQLKKAIHDHLQTNQAALKAFYGTQSPSKELLKLRTSIDELLKQAKKD